MHSIRRGRFDMPRPSITSRMALALACNLTAASAESIGLSVAATSGRLN